MLKPKNFLFIAALSISFHSQAQKTKTFTINSPDGNIQLKVEVGEQLQWSVTHQSQTIIVPSTISLTLQTGEVLGQNPRIANSKILKVDDKITTLNYKKDTVADNYSQLMLNCKGDYGVIFRAYNDGVAYRFFTKRKDSLIVKSEEANFNFADDDYALHTVFE